VVQIRDAGNNPVPQAGVVVTATTVSGTGGLTNGTATTNASGVATFSTLTLTGAGGNVAFRFTSPGLMSGDAGVFTNLTGPAAALSLTMQPAASATSGVALATQPVVQLRDAAGNLVPQAGAVVTATTVSATGTLTNATATTSASGVATFGGLTLTGAAGTYQFRFTSPGLATATANGATGLSP
jgi:hypothetical protein